MFFRPIRDLAEKYNILQNAMASAERIFLLLDRPAVDPEAGSARLVDPMAEIRFEKVWLAYNDGEMILKEIDLTIHAGETVAIVGATGSGKTSLVNLLVRFYDPSRGRVRFNGIDTSLIPSAVLRKRIALVMQDPFLFSGSLADNLFFAADNLPEDRKAAIIDASRCQALVSRLPDGLDTTIMEGGASLSSGERQLISVARAFAADPEIIILDEATSYVDSQTEIELQQAITNLMQGRTSVVVAHRLTTARSADRIVVLSAGRMVETGSHAQLMAAGGYYYRLYQLQGHVS
jgi:ATP-binding cassette subfamily B multidrug efflux pump